VNNNNHIAQVSQCRNVVWLPGAISEASVTTSVCSSCAPGYPIMDI